MPRREPRPATACGRGLLAPRLVAKPRLAKRSVLVQQAGKLKFRRGGGKPLNVDLNDLANRESTLDRADVLLEPPHHDIFQHLLLGGNAAAEPLGIENLEQGGETVRMAVVRRRGEKQTVFEALGQFLHGSGGLRVDRVSLPAGWGRVVCLVQDQQCGGAEIAEPVEHRSGVTLVDQQAVRDQETGVRRPRVYSEAAFAADALHVFLVEDFEDEPEAGFEFLLPLEQHRRRAGHDDLSHLFAKQQFAGNQAGLDGLPQPDIVGDEQVDARQKQCLSERFELVSVEANAGAEGGLEESGIGRGDAVPAKGVKVGGEEFRFVEPAFRDGIPRLGVQRLGIDLVLPEHFQRLTLSIVVDT